MWVGVAPSGLFDWRRGLLKTREIGRLLKRAGLRQGARIDVFLHGGREGAEIPSVMADGCISRIRETVGEQ